MQSLTVSICTDSLNRPFLKIICHLDNTSMPYGPFAVQSLTCELELVTKMLFLTSWLETHVTGQHR